jgi:hypothetical protein
LLSSFTGSNRVCGMDEFSVTVSAVGRDKKDKEVLELLEDLPIAVEDQQVGVMLCYAVLCCAGPGTE